MGHEPAGIRTPGSGMPRFPRDNEAVEALLETYRDGAPTADEFPTEAKAQAWKERLVKATRWLRTYEIQDYAAGTAYDIRATPKVERCIQVDSGKTYYDRQITDETVARLIAENHDVRVFWRVVYWAHAPHRKGFRATGKDTIRRAVENSTRSRGVALPNTPGMPARPEVPAEPRPQPAQLRRTVLYRKPLLPRLAPSARAVITLEYLNGKAPGPAAAWVLFCW